jgi:hypothetical protein
MAFFRRKNLDSMGTSSGFFYAPHVRSAWARQLIQNAVLFAGIMFAHLWTDGSSIARAIAAYVILGLVSYSVLYLADLIEREKGEWQYIFLTLHGKFPVWFVAMFWVVLAAGYVLEIQFGLVLTAYFIIALAHDLFFRKMIILDVIILSIEFSLKATAGVEVLPDVVLSPWLVACTFLFSAVVSLGKRRNELMVSGPSAGSCRAETTGYSEKLLDQMMAVVTSSAFLAFTLYTIDDRTKHILGNTRLLYTSPFVLFGILRYLYLVYQTDLTQGSEISILKDKAMLINIVCWLIGVGAVLVIS